MSTPADDAIDDPGADPKGLDAPRNPLAGPDQDSGRGTPHGTPGLEGQSMMPEAPGEDDENA